MTLLCDHCGKTGTLDEASYSGKRLRLRCPYCASDFTFAVPGNGNIAAMEETVMAPHAVPPPLVKEPPAPPPPQPVPPAPPPKVAPPPPVPVMAPVPVTVESDVVVTEAKRIARLIISEIKLYNQDKLTKIGTKKEVLALLKNDLIRGKQHYDGRIASRLPAAGPDYFMESVKEILLTGKN